MRSGLISGLFLGGRMIWMRRGENVYGLTDRNKEI